MEFQSVRLASKDKSKDPATLTLWDFLPMRRATNTRQVSLNEEGAQLPFRWPHRRSAGHT